MTTISPKVEVSTEQIAGFCQHWQINEFALFGSILRDDFRPDSDVDVLVSFAPQAKWSLWDIIKMKEELKTLFRREVDLVQKDCLRNPFRRYEILSTKQVIYAAK
ncbi:nucleotidyltransferase family protein [Coleofasciculus chthonoplastes]|uniref:nucleotidyltransferase family protein n=1 Tax=Coleofasciculus chthonoplastes TaxID=64178 RepID=UPI0032F137C9